MRSTKKTAFFIFVCLITVVTLVWLGRYVQKQSSDTQDRFSQQFREFDVFGSDRMFPAFEIYDLQGRAHGSVPIQGRLTLINFWASWCAPCIVEIPTLQKLEEMFSDQAFQVVYISLDYPPDSDGLRALMAQFNIPDIPTYYIKDKGVWGELGINGLPTSFLVSPQGRIMYKMLGDTDWKSSDIIDFLGVVLSSTFITDG